MHWVAEVVAMLDSSGPDGYPAVSPMFAMVETDGSCETAVDLERHAMAQAIEDMKTLEPLMHAHLQTWRAFGHCEGIERVWAWLERRTDQMFSSR